MVKTFSDGTFLEYDTGKIDDWCVYLVSPNGTRRAPRDVDYFEELKQYANKYGPDRVYSDYVQIYDLTGKEVDNNVLIQISQIATSYGTDALSVDVLFTVLYMAMISEERRKNTRLGRRIKRLGIYALLFEGRSVQEAATFMIGMHWKEIDTLCKEQGF